MYLKLCFGITLLFSAVFGDVITIWYENNMAEEYLIIVSVVFIILTVAKMKQHKFLK
jgi:hypothetical protein